MFKLNTLTVLLLLALLGHANSQGISTDSFPVQTGTIDPLEGGSTDGDDLSTDAAIGTDTTQRPIISTTTTTTTTPIAPSETKSNLGLILGLSLGLGIPFIAAIIGGLIYYFKFYKHKKQRVDPVNTQRNTTIGAAKDIPMAPVPKGRKPPIVAPSDTF